MLLFVFYTYCTVSIRFQNFILDLFCSTNFVFLHNTNEQHSPHSRGPGDSSSRNGLSPLRHKSPRHSNSALNGSGHVSSMSFQSNVHQCIPFGVPSHWTVRMVEKQARTQFLVA